MIPSHTSPSRRTCSPRGGGAARRARRTRGQSLIIAITAMFVLLFVGGIFVALVARNVMNTGRARQAVGALQFAEAGIQYCDQNLQYSPDGADWRPTPTPPINLNDPDRVWLDQGYSRVNLGNGRALVRVSMRPDPRQPLGRNLRIESVGRAGFLNPDDPTTFLNSPAPRLRRELVAYKAIGITDYLRFITNRDNDTRAVASLGVPAMARGLWMQLGGLPVSTPTPYPFPMPGAPIRANSALHLMHNVVIALDRRNSETLRAAGPIRVEPATGNARGNGRAARINDLQATGGSIEPLSLPQVLGSDRTDFTTFGGLLMDDGATPDANGYPRMTSRLDPPLIDAPDPATSVTRYRALTRNSGRIFTDRNGNTYNTGRIGLGSGVYVDNASSVEAETTAVQGGRSLRSVWLQPGSNTNWKGPFYIPPGAFIEFGPQLVQLRDGSGNLTGSYGARPGFRIVRDDRANRVPLDQMWNAPFTLFVYRPAGGGRPVLKLENEPFRSYLRSALPSGSNSEADIDAFLPEFNGVIFVEGNARVRGVLPSRTSVISMNTGGVRGPGSADPNAVNPPAITLVSDKTIYIEGSLVRESPESMIALLAHDYVTVNTTLFVAPVAGNNLGYVSSFGNDLPPFHTEVVTGNDFAVDVLFADNPAAYTPAAGQSEVTTSLVLRHGTAPGLTYINMFVNEATTAAGSTPEYEFNVPSLPPTVYRLDNAQQQGSYFEQQVFPLLPRPGNSSYTFAAAMGVPNPIRLSLDPNYTSGSGEQAYLMDHPMVVPLDVRIEAVIYAQDGSFYIIPGYPLNNMADDTRDQALARGTAQGLDGQMVRPAGTNDAFPFYGEPVDVRITIVGAISENRTAPIADQAAWMQLWGWIPTTYGSTGNSPTSATARLAPLEHVYVGDVGANPGDIRSSDEQAEGITRGLRFIYDPALAAPYDAYNPDGGRPFRTDNFDRILPPLPRLPVCPGFVFYGEVP